MVSVLTRNVQVGARFPAGELDRIRMLAERDGVRRAEWVRKLVLDRVDRVLATQRVSPLPSSRPHDMSEGLLVRLSRGEHKRLWDACQEEGMVLSSYIRAICEAELRRRKG